MVMPASVGFFQPTGEVMKKVILITLFAIIPSFSHQQTLTKEQEVAINFGQQVEIGRAHV